MVASFASISPSSAAAAPATVNHENLTFARRSNGLFDAAVVFVAFDGDRHAAKRSSATVVLQLGADHSSFIPEFVINITGSERHVRARHVSNPRKFPLPQAGSNNRTCYPV